MSNPLSLQDKIKEIRKPELKFPALIDPIRNRFSPRNYLKSPIPQRDMKVIFEAARWSPSARNYQPWFFYWTDNTQKTHVTVTDSVPDKHSWIKNAPTLVICCFERLDPIDGSLNKWAMYDLGAAVISMVLQAQSMGYYCRQVGNFNPEKLSKNLSLSNAHTPFVLLAMGKIGNYELADQETMDKEMKPTGRKEVIFKRL